MLMTQYTASPAGGDTEKLRPIFRRTPLHPKNNYPTKPTGDLKPVQIGKGDPGKENRPPLPSLSDLTPSRKMKIESLELGLSLAEELRAIREKLERLRLNRVRTEKMLKERDMMLQIRMKELQHRGQIQRQLEVEVDRLYRLNELKSYCMSTTPIRSLRAKEQDKVKPIHQNHEATVENLLQSPNSEEATSEIAPEPVVAVGK